MTSIEEPSERRLTYLFNCLPYQDRLRVVIDLMLVYDQDEGLDRAVSWRVWLARAKETGALPLLVAHLSRAFVFWRFQEALFAYPQGGEQLAEELTAIKESAEFSAWKKGCQ